MKFAILLSFVTVSFGKIYNLTLGKEIDYLPAAVDDQLKVKPIYKTFPGWKSKTKGTKDINKLPEKARNYIKFIEDFIEAKVSSISTSPEREDTILLENPFEV